MRSASGTITSWPHLPFSSALMSWRSRRHSIRRAALMQVRTAVATAMSKVRPLLSPSPRKWGPRSAASVVEQKADFRRRGNRRTENCNLETAALYRLMIWLSPAYPVGAFAYSSGIEWAVESGDIDDTETLRAWLESMLTTGAGI